MVGLERAIQRVPLYVTNGPKVAPDQLHPQSIYLARTETADRHLSHNGYDLPVLIFLALGISRARREALS